MKAVQAGILAIVASAIAVVLWHAAVQARRVGYGQVVAVEFQSMEGGGYGRFPLTPEQEKYKKTRDEQQMRFAKAAQAQLYTLSRHLLLCELGPAAILVVAIWMALNPKQE